MDNELSPCLTSPQKHLFLQIGTFVWTDWVGLQYPKSMPTFILCHGTLYLKLRRLCQLEIKLSYRTHPVFTDG